MTVKALKKKNNMAFKMKGHTLPGINQRSETQNLPDGRAKSSAFQKDGEKKDFSNESKYKIVKKGRTGGIAQDKESGKYYNTAFGHEMVSDTTSNPFDPSIKTVDWYKKEDDE